MAREYIRAGELRHRATFERPVQTAGGGMGQRVTSSWSALRSRRPVRVQELMANEVVNAEQLQSHITHLVETRWFDGLTPRDRIIWHDGATNRTLAIVGPPLNPDGHKRKMLVNCKEAR